MNLYYWAHSPEEYKKAADGLTKKEKDALEERWPEECTELKQIPKSLNRIAEEIYQANKAKEFWPEDVNDRNVGEALMLMVSELSEGMEAHRKDLPDSHLPQYPGLHVELADCLIRILDFAGAHQIDIEKIISDKLKYNANRPPKHGKKY